MRNIKSGNTAVKLIQITNEVLGLKKNNVNVVKPLANNHFNINKNDTNTDLWLKSALSKSSRLGKTKSVTLSIPLVLQTLKQLRALNHANSYFRLFSKIKATDINWITGNQRSIQPSKYLPIEFYNEFALMLNKMASKEVSSATTIGLAKYCLQLMRTYNDIVTERHMRPNYRFYRDCIKTIISSESKILLNLTLKFLQKSKQPSFLLHFANLEFYTRTSQSTLLVDYLNDYIYDRKFQMTKLIQELYQPLFSKILKQLLMLNAESECCLLYKTMTSEWNIFFDDHEYTILYDLSDRKGAFELKKELQLSYLPEVKDSEITNWKVMQLSEPPESIIAKLQEENVNPFENNSDFMFLQTSFSLRGRSAEFWKSYINDKIILSTLSLPLKALYLQCLLSSLVSSGGSLRFIIALLKRIFIDLNSSELFLQTSRLKGMQSSTSFNILFELLGRNSSVKLTSQYLLNYLQHNAQKFNYSISNRNYISIFIASLSDDDNKSLFYFFYQYLIHKGSSLYKDVEKTNWALPADIEMFLKETNIPFEMLDLIDTIKLRANSPQNSNIFTKSELTKIFGENFVPAITKNSLIDAGMNVSPQKSSPELSFKRVVYDYNHDRISEYKLREMFDYLELISK